MLSHELYTQIKGRVGSITLKNGNTQTVYVLKASDCISNHWIAGSPKYQNLGKNGASVVLPEDVAKTLGFQASDAIELINTLTSDELTLWECGQDNTYKFGSSWMVHQYTAKAFFAGWQEADKDAEYPGIYLNKMQFENLNLTSSLIPLCGVKKLTTIQTVSSRAIALVHIYYQNMQIQAAVYITSSGLYPRAAININRSLFEKLPQLRVGDTLQICSRFDVHTFDEAERLKSVPSLETLSSTPVVNWIELFDKPVSPTCVFPKKFENNLEDRLILTEMFKVLTNSANILASNPKRFVHAINFMDNLYGIDISDTQEYA